MTTTTNQHTDRIATAIDVAKQLKAAYDRGDRGGRVAALRDTIDDLCGRFVGGAFVWPPSVIEAAGDAAPSNR